MKKKKQGLVENGAQMHTEAPGSLFIGNLDFSAVAYPCLTTHPFLNKQRKLREWQGFNSEGTGGRKANPVSWLVIVESSDSLWRACDAKVLFLFFLVTLCSV